MSEQQASSTGGGDTPADTPQHMTVEDLRRAAENCRDLRDAALMAKAWDEPTPPDVESAPKSSRRFGHLPSIAIADTFDDPLPRTEIAAWEGDSHS
ncbi:hypothetical protein ACXPWS_15275 [Mycobacterium sp. BMJ-28]